MPSPKKQTAGMRQILKRKYGIDVRQFDQRQWDDLHRLYRLAYVIRSQIWFLDNPSAKECVKERVDELFALVRTMLDRQRDMRSRGGASSSANRRKAAEEKDRVILERYHALKRKFARPGISDMSETKLIERVADELAMEGRKGVSEGSVRNAIRRAQSA